MLPHFLRIECIFVMPNNDIVFWCKKIHTIGYYRHLWSYEVMFLCDEISTTCAEQADHHPLDCYSLSINGIRKTFVRLRYDLSDLEREGDKLINAKTMNSPSGNLSTQRRRNDFKPKQPSYDQT